MKILLDECVDRRLTRDLAGHSVTTVPRHGWAGIKNGDLLALAEKEFDAFITVDRKLAKQQDLTEFDIASKSSNSARLLRPFLPATTSVGGGNDRFAL